jgi:hypothetical protein
MFRCNAGNLLILEALNLRTPVHPSRVEILGLAFTSKLLSEKTCRVELHPGGYGTGWMPERLNALNAWYRPR